MRPIIKKSKLHYLELVKRRADFKNIFMMNDKDEKDLDNLVLTTFKLKKGNKVKVETMLML